MPETLDPGKQILWARIKPRNEKKGLKMRRFSVFGLRFEEEAGWYKFERVITLQDGRKVDVATYLANVHNDNDDMDSPLAFDVMTEAEARQLEADERKAAELRATAKEARPLLTASGDMTTADLSPASGDGDGVEQPVALAQPVKRKPGRPRKNPLPTPTA